MSSTLKRDIIDKVIKLMRLAESDNEHEAALAEKRANELMKKYDVSEEDLEQSKFEVQRIETDWYRIPKWDSIIMTGVSKFLGVFVAEQNGRGSSDQNAAWYIAGHASDIENAVYMWKNLSRQMTEALHDWKEEAPRWNGKVRSDFRKGYTIRVQSRLADLTEKVNQHKITQGAIIKHPSAQKRKQARKKMASEFDLQKGGSFQLRDSASTQAGRKAGAEADIHAGVRGKTQSKDRQLAG